MGKEYPNSIMFGMAGLGFVFAALAFFGFPILIGATSGGAPWWSWSFPHVAMFGIALGIASYLNVKHKDTTGLTWYGKFGEAPGQMLLWCMVGFIPYFAMTIIIPAHFVGIGNHNIPNDSPLYTYVTEDRKCTDRGTWKEFCALEESEGMCQKIRDGDLDWARKVCDREGLSAIGVPGGCLALSDVFHGALDNCMATCGCGDESDIFSPVAQTGPAKADFVCNKNGGCNRVYGNCLQWNFNRHPRWMEMHASTGVLIFILSPIQFVKQIRMLFDKTIHRWLGRFLVLLAIPNMFSLFVLCFVGSTGIAACHPYIIAWRVLGACFAVLFCNFLARAVYHVKNGNIPAHAENMMRSYAMWFGIGYFRIMAGCLAAVFPVASNGWALACSFAIGFGLPLSFAEFYIRYSQRFVTPSNGEQDLDKPLEGATEMPAVAQS